MSGNPSGTLDLYAKDGGPGRYDLCVVFTMTLCALDFKQALISLLFQVKGLWNYVNRL